jgi:hypothetical protein
MDSNVSARADSVPGKRTGRPTKFTEAVCTRLIANVQAGYHYEPACKLAGVSYPVFRDWMVRGEAGEDPYQEFSEQIHRAEAEAERVHFENITEASKRDWHASGWVLARRFPERWADQSRRTVQHTGSVQVEHVHTLALPAPGDWGQLAGLLGQAEPTIDGEAHEVTDTPTE